MGSNHEKNEGGKSRDTLPLSKQNANRTIDLHGKFSTKKLLILMQSFLGFKKFASSARIRTWLAKCCFRIQILVLLRGKQK